MRDGLVWGLIVAIPRVNDLSDTNRDLELGAIAESHQGLATKFGILLDEQTRQPAFRRLRGNQFAVLTSAWAPWPDQTILSLIRGSGQPLTTLQVWQEERNRRLGN